MTDRESVLLAALADLVDQLNLIGIPEWHGADGLCLKQAQEALGLPVTCVCTCNCDGGAA